MYVGVCDIEQAARYTCDTFNSKSEYHASTYLYHVSAWKQQVRYLLAILRLLKRPEPYMEWHEAIHVFKQGDRHFPFVLMPDYMNLSQYCFMSPFDYLYDYNQMCFDLLPGFNVPVATMPVIHRQLVDKYEPSPDGWRQFLKNEVEQNYIPHFFGEKSKRVEWNVYRVDSDSTRSMCSFGMITENFVHNQRVLTINGDDVRHHPYTVVDTAINEGICQGWELATSADNWFIRAKCIETGNTVCLVHVMRSMAGYTSKKIAVNHDPKYKQYSLVPMSNLVAIRHFMLMDRETQSLNLGINFTPAGDYKSAINLTHQPMYNFPNVEAGTFP